MITANLIAASELCKYHQVEYTLITSLYDAGLLEISIVNGTAYVAEEELYKLEKMIHLHQELEINVAGIEAVTHLLEKIDGLQTEVKTLKNRLKRYED